MSNTLYSPVFKKDDTDDRFVLADEGCAYGDVLTAFVAGEGLKDRHNNFGLVFGGVVQTYPFKGLRAVIRMEEQNDDTLNIVLISGPSFLRAKG